MTPAELEDAYLDVVKAGWPDNGTGPWIDAMDLALRKRHRDHQFLIVGFALAKCMETGSTAAMAAWSTLLGLLEKRSQEAPIDPGYGRMLRPPSVLPGYRPGRRRR